MATADRRAGAWRWAGPIVVLALAVVVVVGQVRRPGDPVPSPARAGASVPGTGVDDVVEVEATSRMRLTTLAELTRASDLVVRGTVEQTSRGRVVGGGDPTASDENGIVSRIVTLRVDEVLKGSAPTAGDEVLVEEEGWLTDGRPIAVNGARPSAPGDTGIWFLQSVRDPELTGYIATNGQGRYLVAADDPTGLVGGDRKDALVQQLAALTPDALAQAVRAQG
jgi:hypothetical protein